MKASEAAAKAAKVREERERERLRLAQEQRESDRRDGEALAKRLLPDIRKRIGEAVEKGWTGISEEFHPSECASWACHFLTEALRPDGYRCTTDTETRNMGDSEAPYDVTTLYLHISWGER